MEIIKNTLYMIKTTFETDALIGIFMIIGFLSMIFGSKKRRKY